MKEPKTLAAHWDSVIISSLVALFSILYYALFVLLLLKPRLGLTDGMHRLLVPEYIDLMAENLFYLLFSYRNILIILTLPFFIGSAIKASGGSLPHRLQCLGFLLLYVYQFGYNAFFYVSAYPPYVSLLSITSICVVVVSLASFVRRYRREVRQVEFGFGPKAPYKGTIAYLVYKIVGISLVLLITIGGFMGVGGVSPAAAPVLFFYYGTIMVLAVMIGIYAWVIIELVRKRDHGCTLSVIVLTNDKIPDLPTLALIFLIIPFFILYLVPGYLSKRLVTDIGGGKAGGSG